MEFFDSHSHYNDEEFDNDREEMINATHKNGITTFMVCGADIKMSQDAVNIAKSHSFMYATCGIYPGSVYGSKIYNGVGTMDEDITVIEKLVENNLDVVKAIGEIGLDYYYGKENKENQKIAFERQIDIANKYNLPIVIHTRDAVMDTLDVLKSHPCNKKGIFHCCPLNPELIKEGLKLGYYISFSGIITFKNAEGNAKQVVNMVPLDRLLIETDSPSLAPVPFRGTRNNSMNVKLVAEKIAELTNIPLEQIAKQTYENAKNIFNIV